MRVEPAVALRAVFVAPYLAATAEAHPLGVLGALHLPRVAVSKPVIGLLDLAAVLDILPEHAVFIADAVPHHRQLQRGATIQEAGSEAPEAAVTESRVHLLFCQFLEIHTELLHRLAGRTADAEVQKGVSHGAPHQELEG